MTTYRRHGRGRSRDWQESYDGAAGTCFTISWNHLERMLKSGRLPSEFFADWCLNIDQKVDRFSVREDGITVYVVNKN